MTRVEASYMMLQRPRDGAVHVWHTKEILPGLLVDLNEDGSIIGIENVGGVVGIAELIAVLRKVPLEPPKPAEEARA